MNVNTTAPDRGQKSRTFDRLSPVTGEVASTGPACRRKDAVAAANRAARAFASWSKTAPQERRAILNRMADLIDANAAEIRDAMQAEIGATEHWVRFNIEFSKKHAQAAADMTMRINGMVTQDPDGLSLCFREPVGVCLAMAPWNAPFVLAVRSVATALACGNTVVMKASEICPATHLLVGKILTQAGLPEGVLNIVTHAAEDAEEVVTALIGHEAIRRVNFTGSTRVGRIIAGVAAQHLKRCLLELGSKAPLVVLADADLDAAADAAAFGSFFNQGQICMSSDRIVVVDSIADAFIDKLCSRARRLRAGDPRDGGYALGPVVSAHVAGRLDALVQDAVAKGAKLLVGGEVRGTFMDATVLDHVTQGMAAYAEESFGPLAVICRARSEAEAISIANDTHYGLTASIFSRDTTRPLALARQIDSGICQINSPTLNDRPDLPFGGVKDSGYGRFGWPAVLDEFTELRWISLSGKTPSYPFSDDVQ